MMRTDWEVYMPERVVLTPLPDQEILGLAKEVIDGMKIQNDIEVKHVTPMGYDIQKMNPDCFTTHFCLRFLGRIFSWHRTMIFEGILRRIDGRAK